LKKQTERGKVLWNDKRRGERKKGAKETQTGGTIGEGKKAKRGGIKLHVRLKGYKDLGKGRGTNKKEKKTHEKEQRKC